MTQGRALHQKAVLRMRDGRLRKCSIYAPFSAAHHKVQVLTEEGRIESVDRSDLKAIFFVRDFDGNPRHESSRSFQKGSPQAGWIVRVTFPDGEVIVGRVLNLAEGRPGFFLFPADPKDNNERVFVLRADDVSVEVMA